MQKPRTPSLWSKGFNWLANHTYRQIPAVIATYSIKNTQPQSLAFEDYVRSPKLAREAGLLSVRQGKLNRRKDKIQKVIADFKSRTLQNLQKPHELQCPICLQMMNGPVTTSCSHTFCHMCLDEAILFSPTCPVCRSQIRGEQLIVSRSIESLIEMFLARLELEEVQKFVKKELDYGEWVGRRTPRREAIDVGDCIDVRDTEFIWCRATVKDIFPINCGSKSDREAILVHYEGWANVFNEIIALDSQRLATYKFYTSRLQIPHYNLSADNTEHLRSPVVTGEYVPPPMDLNNSNRSFDSDEEADVRAFMIERGIRLFRHQMSVGQQSQAEISLMNQTYINPTDPFELIMQGNNSFRGSLLDQSQNLVSNNFWHNNYMQRLQQERNSTLRSQQSFQGNLLLRLNERLRPASANQGPNRLSQSGRQIFTMDHHNRSNYSRLLASLQNSREQHINLNDSLEDSFQMNEINLVDSLELYFGNDSNLSSRLVRNMLIRRQDQQDSSFQIQLRSSESDNIVQTEPSFDYGKLSLEEPEFTFRRTNSQQKQQNQIESQLCIGPTCNSDKFLDQYFKSFQTSLTPFEIDIQAIQNNQSQIAHEIKQIEIQQQEMELNIEEKQRDRKRDMERWKEVSRMIKDYTRPENPQGEVVDPCFSESFVDHLELQCFQKHKIRPNPQQLSLNTLLHKIQQKELKFDLKGIQSKSPLELDSSNPKPNSQCVTQPQ